ncbi:MAG: YceI family protein, partial [Thermoanaerobaculia bacterium]
MATQTDISREVDGRILPAPGTWLIDPVHSVVQFSVRHMMVSRLRGRFRSVSGIIRIDNVPERSSVEATIDIASLDTGDPTRDSHLLSADFFDVEHFSVARFVSAAVTPTPPFSPLEKDEWRVTGNLTIKDVTRPVEFELELGGVAVDPWGSARTGFRAWTEIEREQFGISWNQAIEAGGFLIGKTAEIEIEIEAVR